MNNNDTYRKLIERQKEVALINSCSYLLSWEQETYMPAGGNEHRSNQLALLAGMAHEKNTDPVIGDWLDELESSDWMDDPQCVEAVNIRGIRRSYNRDKKMPQALVEEIAKHTSISQPTWAKARKESDFSQFQPALEKMLALKIQQAEAIGYQDNRYDALIDEFEMGASSSSVKEIFSVLRNGLVELNSKIAGSNIRPRSEILTRNYPVDAQRSLAKVACSLIGFDFNKGRLDDTTHPFCTEIGPGDTRITSRYNPRSFNEAFFGALHETGHGLYEQGLLHEHYGTPMGRFVSLGVHESQSRLWENEVGRSLSFWEHVYPIVKGFFPNTLSDVDAEDFHFAVNETRPTYIRVESDELTYNLHIFIRFEMEMELINENLKVEDIPAVWNQKMNDYLGIIPENDRLGCLQDVHWSAGLFGYFPTYTLGNIYGAQIFKAANEQLGDLNNDFRQGNFQRLLDWLRSKVHHQGMRYIPTDLIENISGSKPNPTHLLERLSKKYSELYQL